MFQNVGQIRKPFLFEEVGPFDQEIEIAFNQNIRIQSILLLNHLLDLQNKNQQIQFNRRIGAHNTTQIK